MDPNALIPIYWPRDYLEASFIKQTLEEECIPCHIDGENITFVSGSGPFGNSGRCRMQLVVRFQDAERTKEIIESTDWPRYT